MALINFQKQFAKVVKNGKKRQTIRKQRKYPIKVGETLYLYIGLRTKKARKLRTEKCKWIDMIKIYQDGIRLGKRWRLSHKRELDEFAQADGFENYTEMVKWFSETHGLPFEGILIKW